MPSLRTIDFMGKRVIATIFSITLVVLSLGSLITKSLNFGLDFTGGTQVTVAYTQAVMFNAAGHGPERISVGDAHPTKKIS